MAKNPLGMREKPTDPPRPPNTQTDPSRTEQHLTIPPMGPPAMFGGEGLGLAALPPPSSVYGLATPPTPTAGPTSTPDIATMTNAQMMPQMGQKASAAGGSFGPQDAMLAAYLAATLGGTVGTLMKPLPPPPPIAVPQSSPNPITANAAMQSSLGLAQNRKQRTPHQFGRGG